MNGDDIAYLLKDEKSFGGVFASDQFPQRPRKKCYVLNTMPSTHPGEHWVVADYTASKPTFFDSFGRSPTLYGFPRASYSRKRLQGDSNACGIYCCYYIHYRSRGYAYARIFKDFKNRRKNDAAMVRWLSKFSG